MFQNLLEFLKNSVIDINNYRAESYDNTSSMNEKYNSMAFKR